MADPKQQQKPVLRRAAEKVSVARLDIASHIFSSQQTLVAPDGSGDGVKVAHLALHPAGLLVVPKIGPYAGKRVIVPGARVEFAVVSTEEE